LDKFEFCAAFMQPQPPNTPKMLERSITFRRQNRQLATSPNFIQPQSNLNPKSAGFCTQSAHNPQFVMPHFVMPTAHYA
jgi:hypothetical protein